MNLGAGSPCICDDHIGVFQSLIWRVGQLDKVFRSALLTAISAYTSVRNGHDLHPGPDPGIDLVVALWTGNGEFHTETGNRDQELVDDIIGVTDPSHLLPL